MYTSKHIFNLDYQRHAIWNAAFLQFRSSAQRATTSGWSVNDGGWNLVFNFTRMTIWQHQHAEWWMKNLLHFGLFAVSRFLSLSFSVGRYICVRHKLFLCVGVCVSTGQTHPDWHPACIILNTGSPHTFSKRLYNCFVCTKYVWITYW